MKDSKLIFILKSLDKTELRTFTYFLSSKLFNRRESPIRLLSYLSTQLKSPKPKLEKSTVFSFLFPGKPYNDKVLRDIMAYISVPLENFLAFQKLHETRGDELLALSKAYRERNMLKLFEVAAKKSVAFQEKSTLRDSNYHERNYQIEQEYYYASTQKGRADKTNLAEVTRSLDISYFANRLRQSCYLLSHQSVYNIEYDFALVEDIIKEVKRKDLLHIPAISIYYYGYLAQLYPDKLEYFQALKSNLVANSSLFKITEMKDIYLIAINIAIKRYNQGSEELVPDLLELYESGINKKILLTNNVLSRFTYKNLIVVAVTQKKYQWAKDFMETYSSLLEEEYRTVTYQYNMAKLHCEKKEFEEALEFLLLTTSSDDVYINIDTKILLARIYYEQNNQDALFALIDSFKKILARKKKVLGYQYVSYKNFIDFINKLVSANSYDRAVMKDLLNEVQAMQALPNKHWFIEQLQ